MTPEHIAKIIDDFGTKWIITDDWYQNLFRYIGSYLGKRWMRVKKNTVLDILQETLLWIKLNYKTPKIFPYWVLSYFNLCLAKFWYKVIATESYAIDVSKNIYEKILSNTTDWKEKDSTLQLMTHIKDMCHNDVWLAQCSFDNDLEYDMMVWYIISILWTDEYRDLFMLYFIEWLSLNELSTKYNITCERVWQKIKIIKDRIKKNLEI